MFSLTQTDAQWPLHPITLIGIAALLLASTSMTAQAQVTAGLSGVPGDGIPDVYYWAQGGIPAANGEVRDAGFLTLDTDGADFAALLVADANAFFFNGCILCDGDVIFDPNLPPPGFHAYGQANINNVTQWIRTFPLQDDGPLGVFDLAQGPGELGDDYFEPIFDDANPSEALWSFRYGSQNSGQFFSNVTVIPEPACFGLFGVGALALLGLRRR